MALVSAVGGSLFSCLNVSAISILSFSDFLLFCCVVSHFRVLFYGRCLVVVVVFSFI